MSVPSRAASTLLVSTFAMLVATGAAWAGGAVHALPASHASMLVRHAPAFATAAPMARAVRSAPQGSRANIAPVRHEVRVRGPGLILPAPQYSPPQYALEVQAGPHVINVEGFLRRHGHGHRHWGSGWGSGVVIGGRAGGFAERPLEERFAEPPLDSVIDYVRAPTRSACRPPAVHFIGPSTSEGPLPRVIYGVQPPCAPARAHTQESY